MVKFVGPGGAAAAAEKPAGAEKPAADKPAGDGGQPWWDKVIEGGAAPGAGGDGAALKQLEAQVKDERRMREALEKFLDLPRGASVGDVAKAGALERRVKELEQELADAKTRLAAPRVDEGALEKQRQEHGKAIVELEAKVAAAEARASGLEKKLESKSDQSKKELERARDKSDEELAELKKALEDARKTASDMASGGDKALKAAREEADRLGKELEALRQRAHDADRQVEELRAQAESTPKGADPAELERLGAALAAAEAKAAEWEEEHKKVVQEIDEISMEQIEIEDGLKAQVRELKQRLGEPVDDAGAEDPG
jgi:chromosome segregation ATPase